MCLRVYASFIRNLAKFDGLLIGNCNGIGRFAGTVLKFVWLCEKCMCCVCIL